jgi:hypothetical protein
MQNTELVKLYNYTCYASETNKQISIKFGIKNYSENYLANLGLVCTNTTHLPWLKFLFQSLQLYSYLRYFLSIAEHMFHWRLPNKQLRDLILSQINSVHKHIPPTFST